MDSPIVVERVLEQQGRSIAWLAKRAGIDRSHALRMIRGERPLTAEFKRSASEALGVPEDVLFAEPKAAA